MPRKPACGTTTPLRNSKPFLIVKIGNTACMTLIDTGSSLSLNLMSFELWDRYFKQAFPLSEAEIRLTGAGGNGLEIKGKIKAPVTINSKRGNDVKLDLELVVVKGLKAEVIAGMDWLTAGRSSLDLPRLKLTSFGEEFELITACGDNTNSKPTLVKNANDVKIEPQQSIEIRTQAMLQGHTEGRTCMISKVLDVLYVCDVIIKINVRYVIINRFLRYIYTVNFAPLTGFLPLHTAPYVKHEKAGQLLPHIAIM